MKRFFIIDNCLVDKKGHYYEYDVSVYKNINLNEYKPIIIAGNSFKETIDVDIIPFFDFNFWGRSNKKETFWIKAKRKIKKHFYYLFDNRGLFSHLGEPERRASIFFFKELLALNRKYHFNKADVLFFPNMNHWNTISVIKMLEKNSIEAQFKLLYRRNIFYRGEPTKEEFDNPNYDLNIIKVITNEVEILANKSNVYFYTDTGRLKKEYESVWDVNFSVLPIPFRHDYIKRIERKEGTPYRILFIGGARAEKGFQFVPDIVGAFEKELMEGSLVFDLHTGPNPDGISKEAIKKIGGKKGINIIDKVLNEKEYYNLLNNTDIVLLLYDAINYYSRSSCCFIESIVAGKPIITYKNSWMAAEIANNCYVIDSTKEANKKIRDIINNYSAKAKEIAELSDKWGCFHNPKKLVELLLNTEKKPGNNNKFQNTNALIIYPFHDVLNCSCGATLRLTLFVKFLKEHFDIVTVLYQGKESKTIDNINYVGFDNQTKNNFFISRIIRKAIKIFFKVRYHENLNVSELTHIWFCYRYIFDKNIKQLFAYNIKLANIVIMKYFHFSNILFGVAKKYNKKIIVADYDVVAHQTKNKHFKEKLFEQEINALKKADVPVVLAEYDREVFEKAGVNNIQLICNGVDGDKTTSLICSHSFIRTLLADIYSIKLDDDEKICFFIGSGIVPNINAALRIREFSKKYLKIFPTSKVKFILCGTCHPVCNDNNFISLGFAESILIHLLYQIADMIVIPLEAGTGSSLKTAEAFSYGKLILGTDIAYRGITVRPNENCLVCNNLSDYPHLINKYLNDDLTRKNIEEKALLFGKNIDYRNRNNAYLNIFDKLGIPYNQKQENLSPINRKTIESYSEIDLYSVLQFFMDSNAFLQKFPFFYEKEQKKQ